MDFGKAFYRINHRLLPIISSEVDPLVPWKNVKKMSFSRRTVYQTLNFINLHKLENTDKTYFNLHLLSTISKARSTWEFIKIRIREFKHPYIAKRLPMTLVSVLSLVCRRDRIDGKTLPGFGLLQYAVMQLDYYCRHRHHPAAETAGHFQYDLIFDSMLDIKSTVLLLKEKVRSLAISHVDGSNQ